jgi:hypothetical protein
MFGSEGQWDVVGVCLSLSGLQFSYLNRIGQDTFVVGCRFSEKNIYPNPL